MARSARKTSLETRSARARLPMRRAPYFVKIAKGLRLGYYRGSAAGTWIGRRYRGGNDYDTAALGSADDLTDADGLKVFDFWQAQSAARRWAEKQRLVDEGMVRGGPTPSPTRSGTISPPFAPRKDPQPSGVRNTSSTHQFFLNLGRC
jgi:hypothetical protein